MPFIQVNTSSKSVLEDVALLQNDISKMVAELTGKPENYVMTMIQTAVYDGVFDEKEKSKILELIKNYFDLDEDQKLSLFKIAMEVNDNSNDIQQFTRVLNDNLSEEEKLNIIEMLWKIIISDGHIDDYENTLIRKISGLLYISDRVMSGAHSFCAWMVYPC